MRILYLSQYYPPEMGAPAARVSAFTERWAARGEAVTVLTTFPNHPTGVIPPEYRGKLRRFESRRGVRVIRTFLFAAPNRGVVKRSLSYASFAVSAVLLGYGPGRRPDVLVATSPQFLAAAAGWALSRLWGVPLVLEIRDLWPDSIVAVNALRASSPFVRSLRLLERFLYRQADAVISVTRSFVPLLEGRGARIVRFIPNGADPRWMGGAASREEARRTYSLGEAFVAAFVGTIGMAHGLGTVLEAAELLRDRRDILFWLVGEGARRAELEAEAKRRGLDNVRFQGQLPRKEMPSVLAASDAALVLLGPDPLFETVLPSKMFEAMAAGCPVILGVRGEALAVLEESGAGIGITPGDARSLADAVLRLAASPTERARLARLGPPFVAQHYSHDALARTYLEILRAVATGDLSP